VWKDRQVTAAYERNDADLDALMARWSAGQDGLRLVPVPLAPEIRLHLATDAIVFWARMEAEAGVTLPPPFWASAWLGGQVLARFILDHPDVVAGRRVLDLAAGSGLVGVAARMAGAAIVTATDIDPLAVAAVAMNARANAVDIKVSCATMTEQEIDAEVVLVGDAFYSTSMAEMALPVLERAATRGARVLVGDPGRPDLPHDRLQILATYAAADAAADTDAEVRWVHVLELT
jgi:predicted nicotinamide N-methyase